jgi:hypothetical protein
MVARVDGLTMDEANGHQTAVVVRTFASARRVLTVVGLVVLGALALYLTYELGRYRAGFDLQAAQREREAHDREVRRLGAESQELRTRLAEQDAVQTGRAREQAEVARAIGDLQAQVARQEQELEFYRGIVAQGESASGFRIQQMRIVPTADPLTFRVRLSIMRATRPGDAVSGVLALKVEGALGGTERTLELTELTGRQRELPFSFRYFTNIDQDIRLPAGFEPERLVVDLRATQRGLAPVSQSFLWRVEAL